MRKVITTLIFVVVTAISMAQTTDYQRSIMRGNQAVVDDNLRAAKALRIPVLSSWTLNGAKDSIGYIAYNSTLQSFGVYQGNGNWATVATPDLSIYENFKGDTARIGTIFNYGTGGTAISNINQFVTTGSAFSVGSGKIIAAANNAGSVQVPYATALDVYVIQFDYRVTNGVTATNPLNLGFTSINTTVNSSNSVAYVDQSNILTTYASYDNTTVNSTSGLPAYTPGDNMRVVMVYNSGSYLITVYDLTKGTSFSYSANTPFLYNQRSFAHNTAYPSIYVNSGNAAYEITNFQYTSKMKLGGLWGDGDSLTYGISSGAASARYVNIYGGQISAGGGDKALEILARVPEIILTKAKVVYIMSGTNDPDINVWLTNVKSIVSQIQSAGTQVYLIAPPPNNNRSMQPFRDTLAKYYPNNYIDGYTTLLGSGTNLNSSYNGGDGIHLNASGNLVLANIVKGTTTYFLQQNYYVGDIIGAKSMQNFAIPYFYNGVVQGSGIMTDGQNSIITNPTFKKGITIQNNNDWSQVAIKATKPNYSAIVGFAQFANPSSITPSFLVGTRYVDQNKLSFWRYDGNNQLGTDFYIDGLTGTVNANGNFSTGKSTNTGWNFQPYTGGGYSAIYPNSVSPGVLNYTLASNNTTASLNSTGTTALTINGVPGVSSSSTGVVLNAFTNASTTNPLQLVYYTISGANVLQSQQGGIGAKPLLINQYSPSNVSINSAVDLGYSFGVNGTFYSSGAAVVNNTLSIGSVPSYTGTQMLVLGADGKTVSQMPVPSGSSNSSTGTPTISVISTSVGTGATYSIVGTNQDGLITITTGSSGITTLGNFANVTFGNGFQYTNSSTPVITYRTNPDVNNINQIIVNGGAASFALSVQANALKPSSTYQWYYHCGGY